MTLDMQFPVLLPGPTRSPLFAIDRQFSGYLRNQGEPIVLKGNLYLRWRCGRLIVSPGESGRSEFRGSGMVAMPNDG